MSSRYFIKRKGAVNGPFSLNQLKKAITTKNLQSFDRISTSVDGPWDGLIDVYKQILDGSYIPIAESPSVRENLQDDKSEAVEQNDKNLADHKYPSEKDKSKNEKNVESFRIKKKLLGGYKVVYKCPHCYETLTSQESEIRDEEQCPKCEMSFYISDEAANRLELLRANSIAKKVEDKDRSEKRAEWLMGVYIKSMVFGFVALFIICLIGTVAEKATTSGGSSSQLRIDDTTVKYVGRQRLRAILRDPDSLQIISETVVKPGRNGGEVGYRATYRAKNGFGGYTQEEYYTE